MPVTSPPYVVGMTRYVDSGRHAAPRGHRAVARSAPIAGLRHPAHGSRIVAPAQRSLCYRFAVLRTIGQTMKTAGPDPATYEEGQ